MDADTGLFRSREEFLARVTDRLGTYPSDFQPEMKRITASEKTAYPAAGSRSPPPPALPRIALPRQVRSRGVRLSVDQALLARLPTRGSELPRRNDPPRYRSPAPPPADPWPPSDRQRPGACICVEPGTTHPSALRPFFLRTPSARHGKRSDCPRGVSATSAPFPRTA